MPQAEKNSSPQAVNAASASSKTLSLDTSKGKQSVNPENYFNPAPGTFNLDELPILAPTRENISAIAQDASMRMKKLLAENGIQEAPTSIGFDATGKMVLPDDYEHADQFRDAVEQDPVLARELSFVSASAEFQINVQDSLRYQSEYRAAGTGAAQDAVNARYGALLAGKQAFKSIALVMDASGNISPTSGGKPYTDYLGT